MANHFARKVPQASGRKEDVCGLQHFLMRIKASKWMKCQTICLKNVMLFFVIQRDLFFKFNCVM